MHCVGDDITIKIESLTNARVIIAIGQDQRVNNDDLKYYETTIPDDVPIAFPNKAFISIKQEKFSNFDGSFFKMKFKLNKSNCGRKEEAAVTDLAVADADSDKDKEAKPEGIFED